MTNVFANRALALVAALMLLAGCSDPQGTVPGDAAASADAGASPEAGASKGDGVSGGDASGNASGKGGRSGDSRGGSGAGPGDSGGGNGRGSGGGGRNGFAGASEGSSGYLAAGEYVYDQKGYERFCQGPRCNKEQLPETSTMTASYESRSGGEAVIVTESQSSDQQTVTTTTRHTPDQALITKVVIDFAYGSFNYSQTYEPKPPIESLAYPLEPGKSWRGRWKAQTSGDYRIEVVGVSNGVYEIATVTNFRGDFSGRAQATVWIDGDTRAILRTDGDIAVASAFGEYTSSFETTLRSAASR